MMLEEKRKKLKELFSLKGEGNNKRKIENLAVFIVILIITIIIMNTIWNGDKKTKSNTQSNTEKVLAQVDNKQEKKENEDGTLERKLEEILKKMQGVGEAKVLLTYSESSQTVAMYNEDSTRSDTEETGNRKITQSSSKKEVIYQEIEGEKVPVTQSIVKPKIEGAIITAVGAKDSTIKTNIVQAIEAVTGLATHKIQVFEMAN